MIDAEKNIITLVNGKGEKKEFKIKLTFETKENDNFYIVYADPKLDEDGYEKIYAGIYKEENGKYHFVLVDINRFHCKKKPIGFAGTCKNLMQPLNNDELIKFFVFEYAKHRKINTAVVWPYVYFLRHYRNFYDRTKRALKSLPGAKLLINKPINSKHK